MCVELRNQKYLTFYYKKQNSYGNPKNTKSNNEKPSEHTLEPLVLKLEH